jgi:hypothetical protein
MFCLVYLLIELIIIVATPTCLVLLFKILQAGVGEAAELTEIIRYKHDLTEEDHRW